MIASPPDLGAFHATELPCVFNYQPLLRSDDDHMTAQVVASYWINLATVGNPNVGRLPVPIDWQMSDQTSQLYLNLTTAPSHFTNLKTAQCDAFDTIVYPIPGATSKSNLDTAYVMGLFLNGPLTIK